MMAGSTAMKTPEQKPYSETKDMSTGMELVTAQVPRQRSPLKMVMG